MSAVLISDLHLSPDRPQITQAFLGFCQRLRIDRTERLYILGDLFEAWIGDDDDSEFARQIVSALRALPEVGVQVFCQRGNRDFMLGNGFARRGGCTLLADYHLIKEAGHAALLMHGDLLCTDDLDYQRFRRKVQNPLYRWMLGRLPLGYRRRMAARWRARSAEANANKAENIMDVNADAVRAALQHYQVDTLIHGHTHRPACHALRIQHRDAVRMVLGDWDDQIWWIRAGVEGYSLLSAPLAEFS